ncbi:conserved hypothetical protein [Burkholderia diffusa]|uniref:hypothetical protein n=1 Tax=Burkholderia diffusa TaxID=488732 RepID=UPI001CACA57C|nr:hypothetical protein [Burkholderia diffusa]CAG9252423.1 conserved hypothetical protein [Burkholderia diffusa]
MDWSDLAGEVGQIASVVGLLLNGPARAAIGALIASALDTDPTPDAVAAALVDDPDASDKLRALQTHVQALLQPLVVMAEANRAPSPRPSSAHVEPPTTHPSPHWVRPAITFWLLTGALGIVAAILSGTANELLKNSTASLTVGALIAQWFNELKGALVFYFGGGRESIDDEQRPGDRP